jgi:hypothetical protein
MLTVERAIVSLGIPREAVLIEVTGQIRPLDRHNPKAVRPSMCGRRVPLRREGQTRQLCYRASSPSPERLGVRILEQSVSWRPRGLQRSEERHDLGPSGVPG